MTLQIATHFVLSQSEKHSLFRPFSVGKRLLCSCFLGPKVKFSCASELAHENLHLLTLASYNKRDWDLTATKKVDILMGIFSDMLSLQLTLFALIVVGIIVRRTGMLLEQGRKVLSNLLINVILPCNIVHAFMSGASVSAEFIRNAILMIIISVLIQFATAFLNRILFARFKKEQRSVLSYGMICSNSSFVGLPIAEVLFGDMGVMYTSLFQIPLRFTIWTEGLSLFTTIDRKDALRKLLVHPCIVAVFVGLVFMVTGIKLPAFLDDTVNALSRCTTPISMIVIGAILSDAPIKGLYSPAVLYYAFLRLVAFPLLLYVVMMPFGLDKLLINICVLMSAMPAGSTVCILADKYDCDAVFASEITFTSTLLSIVTIPLLSLLF